MTQAAGWDLIHQRLLGSRRPEERGLLEMAGLVGGAVLPAWLLSPCTARSGVGKLRAVTRWAGCSLPSDVVGSDPASRA